MKSSLKAVQLANDLYEGGRKTVAKVKDLTTKAKALVDSVIKIDDLCFTASLDAAKSGYTFSVKGMVFILFFIRYHLSFFISPHTLFFLVRNIDQELRSKREKHSS